ncbi:MAG: type I DNA topoisomerase [Bacilli bacterium]|nr:type I DNA topoisomerase [Bacilli bacterium]
MKLVIVESPTKSETIGRYLGSDFTVLASQGHIRDLSTRGKEGLGINIENGFTADWTIAPRKKAIIAKLSEAAKKASEVYLATDPDREGEAISWHLAQVLGLPTDSVKRLQFHEITKPAITAAIQDPGTIDMKIVKAQETRRMVDRIIGFKISSLFQHFINVRSAGRVQSSTLRMIVDRQQAIDAFVPEEYWTIEAEISINGKTFKAPLTRVDGKPFHCHTKEECEAIVARLPKELSVTSVSKTERSISPKPAFTTSTLQQEAYSKLHFSNTKTQSIAQKLYEGLQVNGEHVGLITYMRTDSTRISPEFFTRHATPYILETYGKQYLGHIRASKGGNNVQDAHEAIRPTGTHRTPDIASAYLTPEQAKLYRLIYCRAMASLMAPKKVERTSIILSGNGLDFSLGGDRVLFKGYSIIFGEYDDKDEETLPEIEQGQVFEVAKVDGEQKFTKPEPQYNMASIVKAMEEKGIGRPSTYASTIDILIKRKYVNVAKGVITPTEDGVKVVNVLKKYFADIASTDYTASMERQLDKVESGEKTFLEAMNEFYGPFMETFAEAKEKIYKDPWIETGENCPECGKPLVYKKNRKGQPFIGCSGFPSCTYIKKDKPAEPAKEVGENCPECGAPLVIKKGRKGEEFLGCSNFPKCRYTRNMNGEKKERVTYTEKDYVKPCPRCKTGFLVMKKGKRVSFLGCTNYPKCKEVEWLNKKK